MRTAAPTTTTMGKQMDRVERTRKVFGGTYALGWFNDWISASERLQLAGDNDE